MESTMKRSTVFVLGLAAVIVAASFGVASAQTATPAAPARASSAAPAAPSKQATTAKSEHHAKPAVARAPAVNLNSATKEDLEKLPGIGEALADKIIAARPFKSRMQLVSKGVLTKAQYAKVRTHVTAKQG